MIDDIREGLPIVKEIIEKNTQDLVIHNISLNGGRHYIMQTKGFRNFYILFKRDFFRSFGAIFNKEGLGESINKQYLDKAIQLDCLLVFIYRTGYVYSISPVEFKEYAESNRTTRITDNGELTYSIPIRLLRRWK